MVEEIDQRLSSFAAENFKFPFSFEAVLPDLRKDLFVLDTNEFVAVYTEYSFGGMIAWPNHLEAILTLIKRLGPCVMVVTDTEANINLPILMKHCYCILPSSIVWRYAWDETTNTGWYLKYFVWESLFKIWSLSKEIQDFLQCKTCSMERLVWKIWYSGNRIEWIIPVLGESNGRYVCSWFLHSGYEWTGS